MNERVPLAVGGEVGYLSVSLPVGPTPWALPRLLDLCSLTDRGCDFGPWFTEVSLIVFGLRGSTIARCEADSPGREERGCSECNRVVEQGSSEGVFHCRMGR